MKILCLNNEYPPVGGGGATASEILSESLVAHGHSVHVVTAAFDGLPPQEQRRGVTIHRVPCVRRHRHYSTAIELATFLVPSYRKALALHREHGFDLNHTHFAVPAGAVSWAIQRKTGLPYVITAHGSDVPGYNPDRFQVLHRIMRPVWRAIVEGSRGITVPSEFLRGLLSDRTQRPIELIPYVFPAEPAVETVRQNRVLCASRLVPRKGVQHVLEALARIESDWEIVVAGDGPHRAVLEAQAQRLGLNVEFVGHLHRDELLDLYRTSKVFAFTSLQENFPMVLLEALAAGCAVVTSEESGCAEVTGNAALKVPAGDVDAVEHALRSLLNDPSEVQRLGRLGRARAEEFSSDRVTSRYEAFFERCLASDTAPGAGL